MSNIVNEVIIKIKIALRKNFLQKSPESSWSKIARCQFLIVTAAQDLEFLFKNDLFIEKLLYFE